jgi:hypothetical protein
MKSIRIAPSLARLALLLALVVPLAGCDWIDNLFGGSSTETTSVVISGRCRAQSPVHQIVCEDDSDTEPAGHLRSIEFRLIASGGLTVAVIAADVGDSKPRQIVFSGLDPGTYSVRHDIADEQGHTASALYRNLSLSP